MADIFTPQSKTIQEIFDGSSYYQVPSYQRPYSWDNEQVDELWEDIYEAFNNDEEEYFLGSIILTKRENSKYLDVVDGQQRLTTLMILFCVLRDIYYSKHKDITKKNRIEGRIKNLENGYERLKLRTQIHNQNQFEKEIIEGINFSKKFTKEGLRNNKFINTALKFQEKINPILGDEETIEGLTEYLLERVRVISIICSNQSFAIKLFQVLNNRGLDLTAADLIKSFLMANLKEENLQTFEQEWIYIENKSKDLGEDLTNLFTYYEYYLLGSNPRKSLYNELEIQFKGKDPLSIIYEFKKLIDYFSEMDKEDPKTIYSLRYLRHDVYWKSILLTAMMEDWDHEEIIKLSKLLRKFYYLYWIADYTSSKIKQTSFNIINWIKKEKDFNFIEEQLNEKVKFDRVITRLKENLDGDIYKSAWSKPLFILLEYEQTDSPNIDFMVIDKDIHLEHILPQSFLNIPYWKSRFQKEKGEKLLNNLGNLTLLSGKKNIEATNSPFDEKIKVYEGKGKDGLTHFVLTQKIFFEYGENPGWKEEDINNRKNFLLKEIERIFNLNFDKDIEEEKKQEFLGEIIKEKEEYDEEYHLEGRSTKVRELYNKIISFIKNVNSNIEINPQRYYISLRDKRNFAFIRIKKSKIKIVVMLPHSKFANKITKNETREFSKGVQKFYNGSCFDVIIENGEDLQEVLDLLEEAYKEQL